MSLPARDAILLRWRIAARIAKLWRWEFWPTSILYAPLVPYFALLSLRYRSLTVWTAANPAIPHSGVVGERKSDILAMLPPKHTVPHALVDARGTVAREAQLSGIMHARGWSFPLISKPNVGERGTGFRILRNDGAALAAIREHDEELVIQPFHPGPCEAGVFYFRRPSFARGQVLSITIKRFPSVVGDGQSTLRRLIWAHPRYRMQAARFLERLGPRAEHVPAPGEAVTLAIAGNHCQGTLFLDGERFITPALTQAFDRIVDQMPGFCFGRFDVRFADEREFEQGRGFGIIELNGVLSESTNIYDPARSLWAAWRTLAKQWGIAYAIGAANARLGHAVTPAATLLRLIRQHARRPGVSSLAD